MKLLSSALSEGNLSNDNGDPQKDAFIFHQRNSQCSRSVQYTIGSKNVLRLIMQMKIRKISRRGSRSSDSDLVISRFCFEEDDKEIYKDL